MGFILSSLNGIESIFDLGFLPAKHLGNSGNLFGYGSIPISTIFRVMNIHLPAILRFTRGTRF